MVIDIVPLLWDSRTINHPDIRAVPGRRFLACPPGYILGTSLGQAHLLWQAQPVYRSPHLRRLLSSYL